MGNGIQKSRAGRNRCLFRDVLPDAPIRVLMPRAHGECGWMKYGGQRRPLDASPASAVTVTALPLAVAAAGARVVSTAPRVRFRVQRHQLGRRPVRPEQPGHDLHRPADVVEERLVAGAQVMLARLTVGGGREPVLRAAPVAGKPHVAVQAELGQGVQFVLPELRCCGEMTSSSMCLSLMLPSR